MAWSPVKMSVFDVSATRSSSATPWEVSDKGQD